MTNRAYKKAEFLSRTEEINFGGEIQEAGSMPLKASVATTCASSLAVLLAQAKVIPNSSPNCLNIPNNSRNLPRGNQFRYTEFYGKLIVWFNFNFDPNSITIPLAFRIASISPWVGEATCAEHKIPLISLPLQSLNTTLNLVSFPSASPHHNSSCNTLDPEPSIGK